MPAAIGDLELVGLIDLLGELDREAEGLAVAQCAPAALVDGELGVDQLAVVLQQPAHAIVRRIRKLFVGREREDDVALGLVARSDIADHVGDEDRRHRLVVDGPASAEIAIGLLQLEGIEVPVLTLCLHDIEMGEKQKRPAHAGAAQSRHQVPLARTGGQNLDVRGWKAAVAQSRRHGLGRAQRVAGGLGGVDLDQLTVDVEKRLLVCRQRLRGGRARQPPDERADDDRCKHAQSQMKWHRSTLLARADHVDPACGSLRRKAAILASSCSPAKSSSVGSCGLSRVAFTMQRKPSGSSAVARN